MSRFEDEDGIDGPFERAIKRSIREDKQRPSRVELGAHRLRQREDKLISDAAEASERYGDDECERFALLLAEAKTLIANARRDLGQDVGGFGLLNLLLDNMDEDSDVCRLLLEDLGEESDH